MSTAIKEALQHEMPMPAPGRLLSLDALRGFDMLWIMGGGKLVHALAKTYDWPCLGRCSIFSHTANILFEGLIKLTPEPGQIVLSCISVLVLKWLFLYFLYRKKIFLKL